MSVNPRKPRHVIVVHGVQLGDAKDLKHDKIVAELINNRKGGNPVKFKTSVFKYEDINDDAIKTFKLVNKALSKTPVQAKVFDMAMDVTADVLINLADGSVAKQIKAELRQKILDIYNKGEPCYVVAHSLGTIYAFDVVNDLMQEDGLFDRSSRRTWPVQGMVTLGSPLGLSMFRKSRKRVSPLGSSGHKFFKWVNFYNLTDPIVSGSIFGKTLTKLKIAESYLNQKDDQGWLIRDKGVDTGKLWMSAHGAYWNDPQVGDDLVDLISN